MKSLFLLLMTTACFQVQNSFEEDHLLYAEREELDPQNQADVALLGARKVFVKYNCMECHAQNSYRFQGFLSFSNEQWLSLSCGDGAKPCVNPSDLDDSYIYTKLNKPSCTATPSECNMPQTGSMSQEDVDVIEDWIEELL